LSRTFSFSVTGESATGFLNSFGLSASARRFMVYSRVWLRWTIHIGPERTTSAQKQYRVGYWPWTPLQAIPSISLRRPAR